MENMKEDAQFFKLLANIDDKKRKIEKSNSEPKIVGAHEFLDQVEFICWQNPLLINMILNFLAILLMSMQRI